ncbi:Cycloaraneosene synthase sdnA [Pseudocercospora fuligena]|uniref:Terpene synthase n=1 Tax=Pseudocercospora fuligena TaxID=685502 RepID=A0A8H6RKL6_9PEZI|nr:Cycloaraneosene synthase sdnA [Pseudocercospora fuligena]
MKAPDKISILLPELFTSFLAVEPRINAAYDIVREESEKAIIEFCKYDHRVTTIVRQGDFSRFVAIAAPDAEESRLRLYCDWCNWVFPYDDLFDNGKLKLDAAAAQAKMQALFANMESAEQGAHTEQCDLTRFHDVIWSRMRASASPGVQRRFLKTMHQFCDAVLKQVFKLAADETPTLSEMLSIRRQSAGVAPLYPLFEYAQALDLPDEFFDSEWVQELEELGMDCALLQNDMLSYFKEEAEGVPHNVVAICRIRGLSAQQAFDHVGNMLDDRLARIESCIATRPQYEDRRLDHEAERYIEGVLNTIRANLYWSFESRRYFGDQADVVRRTRRVEVLKSPAFMGQSSEQLASVVLEQ